MHSTRRCVLETSSDPYNSVESEVELHFESQNSTDSALPKINYVILFLFRFQWHYLTLQKSLQHSVANSYTTNTTFHVEHSGQLIQPAIWRVTFQVVKFRDGFLQRKSFSSSGVKLDIRWMTVNYRLCYFNGSICFGLKVIKYHMPIVKRFPFHCHHWTYNIWKDMKLIEIFYFRHHTEVPIWLPILICFASESQTKSI